MHTYKDGQLVIIIVDDESQDNTVTATSFSDVDSGDEGRGLSYL